MAFFVSCPHGEKKKIHNSEVYVMIITHEKVRRVGSFAQLAGEVPVV